MSNLLSFCSLATEVDATVGEERKSIVETDIPLSISPKKAMDDVDSAEESQWTTDDTSSESEDEAAGQCLNVVSLAPG